MSAKNLLGLPWRVAFALQADGWILRNAIVWHKPNAMPESVKDRLNCRHELILLLVKQPAYWFDLDLIRIPPAAATHAHPRDTAGRPCSTEDKAEIYASLNLQLTYNPGERTVAVQAGIGQTCTKGRVRGCS